MPEPRKLDSCERLMQFFATGHIKDEKVRDIIEDCADLAEIMLEQVPHNQELTVGLRKLIEAKDQFCRAYLCRED